MSYHLCSQKMMPWWDSNKQRFQITFYLFPVKKKQKIVIKKKSSTPRPWHLQDKSCAICGAHRGALELSVCFKHHVCAPVINGWSTWRGFLSESAGSRQEALCALQQGLMHLRQQSRTKEAVIRKTKERRVLVINGCRTEKKKKSKPENRQGSDDKLLRYTGN